MVSAPCFSVVPMYLDTTDSIAFLPAKAVEGLGLTIIDLNHTPEPFDVIAAWHPRYSDDAIQKWIVEKLTEGDF